MPDTAGQAPEQCLYANYNIFHGGIFGDVVIGTQPQSGYPIDFSVVGCEEDDGKLRRNLAQLCADLVTGVRLVLLKIQSYRFFSLSFPPEPAAT